MRLRTRSADRGIVVARLKQKYPDPPPPEDKQKQLSFMAAGLPHSFDLKGASAYTDFSQTDIRAAITRGHLAAVSDKPYRILRADLEAWVNSKRHFVRRMVQAA